MNKAVKSSLTLTVSVTVMLCWLTVGLLGCGGKTPSARSDVAELERAFALKPGAEPSSESTPAAVASRAVAALRTEDWPRAMSLLDWLRLYASLTVEQARAVQNAHGNAFIRLSKLAATGDSQAKAALERIRQEADRH